MKLRSQKSEKDIDLAQKFFVEGKIKEAEKICRKLIEANEDNADALYLLGIINDAYGNNIDGINFIVKAISKNPNRAKYHYSLGLVFQKLKKYEKAIASYEMSININPVFMEAYANLGNIFNELGRDKEAIQCLNKALQIKPDSAMLYVNLGSIFAKQGNIDRALFLYKRALEVNPNYSIAYNNIGSAYREQEDFNKAQEYYQTAIKLSPQYAMAQCNLGSLLLLTGKPDEAIEHYRKAISIKADYAEAHSNILYALNFMPSISQKEIFKESIQWEDIHAKNLLKSNQVYANDIGEKRKLRIGYVSPDFRNHSVNFFFEPVLNGHNKKCFEVYLYSSVIKPDYITERLKTAADHWRSIVGMNDETVSKMIVKDRIDILVDLAGHTAGNRLLVFGYKPAPSQVSWLGYPNTTGMHTIDYRIVDEITDPVGTGDDLHSEELIGLPNSFFCFQPTVDSPDVEDVSRKKTGQITFGSVNNLAKLNKEVLDLWAQILYKIPNSRLLIFGKSFTEKNGRNRFLELFSGNGIEEDRIEMISHVPHLKFLDIHKRIDIILDPFPYNGHTATCNSLWMGVPMITLRGKSHVARVGASILTNIGLPELIAENKEEYVTKAITLAEDTGRLRSLRKGMRTRMKNSPICNAKAFTESLESAYTRIWEKYISSLA